MQNQSKIDVIFAGLIGKNSYFPAQFAPDMQVEVTPNYAFINSGLPSDTFNLVISKKFPSPAQGQKSIARLCERFNSAGLPAAWWTCEEHRNDYVPKILMANGFVESELDTGMFADLADLPSSLTYPAGLTFRLVQSRSDLRAFAGLLAALFEPPDRFVASFFERVAALPDLHQRPLRLFLGLVGGQPVCTSSLFLHDDTAHIFDISTPTALRGRGYGSAITHFTLQYARNSGARHAALQASPDGLNIYKRMGFRELCTFRIHSNGDASVP